VGLGDTQALAFRYSTLNIVHSPEFLTQRCALTDAIIPARNIVGRTIKDDGEELAELYRRRFSAPCLTMKSEESELVKLACNAFFATKVTFFNMIHQTAEQRNLSYETVLRGMLSDGRIAHSHTSVPGPDGQLGFGGACLPKDTSSLLGSTRSSPTDPNLLSTVLACNRKIREGSLWKRSA
jgi:UDPglucose 6-dehydrogenase